MQLRPVSFKYNDRDDRRTQSGLIAEEVMDIIPEMVILKDGQADKLSYQYLTPLLVQGYQHHDKRICMVEAKAQTLDSISAQVASMREQLDELGTVVKSLQTQA